MKLKSLADPVVKSLADALIAAREEYEEADPPEGDGKPDDCDVARDYLIAQDEKAEAL